MQQIAARENQSFSEKRKFFGLACNVNITENAVHLLIPTTFMNLSGQAVSSVAKFYDIAPEEILIAHDELDLSPGIARIKFSGGHGGHNGLRDIIKALNSKDFYRLRIGIGRPPQGADVADFVLKRPTKSEQAAIEDAIYDTLAELPLIVKGEIQQVMKNLHSD